MNNDHQEKVEYQAELLTIQHGGKLLLSRKRTAFLLDVSPMTIDRLREDGAIVSTMVRGQVKFKVMEISRYMVEN